MYDYATVTTVHPLFIEKTNIKRKGEEQEKIIGTVDQSNKQTYKMCSAKKKEVYLYSILISRRW